jgi:hypothetical protein
MLYKRFSPSPAFGGAGNNQTPVCPRAVRFYSRADDTPGKKTPQTHRVNGATSALKLLTAFKTPRRRGWNAGFRRCFRSKPAILCQSLSGVRRMA